MARPADEFGRLVESLLKPSVAVEAAALVGCLVLAWAIVRIARGRVPRPGSIWYGDRVVDGVLFPLLALAFAFAARWAIAGWVPVALFRLALPVLMSLAAIRLTVRVLRVAFPKSDAMRVVERSVSWLAWIAVVLWIVGVLPLLVAELDAIHWQSGKARVSLLSVIEGLLTAAVVLVVVLWVSAAIEQRLLASHAGNVSLRKMAANTLRVLLLFVGLMFALSAAGIDLTALGVLGGAVGVGVGLGLQKLAANYVSGFVILAERALRIGDVVKVDNFEGRIVDITTRYTVIRAANGREAIVPNDTMITQRVENSARADAKAQQTTTVRVAYGSDVEAAMPALAAAAAAVPRVLPDPAPAVQLSAFADTGLELTVAFWIGDPEKGVADVVSGVNLAVLRTLAGQGIEIATGERAIRNT